MPYNKMGGVFYAETGDWKQRRVMPMKLKVPIDVPAAADDEASLAPQTKVKP